METSTCVCVNCGDTLYLRGAVHLVNKDENVVCAKSPNKLRKTHSLK